MRTRIHSKVFGVLHCFADLLAESIAEIYSRRSANGEAENMFRPKQYALWHWTWCEHGLNGTAHNLFRYEHFISLVVARVRSIDFRVASRTKFHLSAYYKYGISTTIVVILPIALQFYAKKQQKNPAIVFLRSSVVQWTRLVTQRVQKEAPKT